MYLQRAVLAISLILAAVASVRSVTAELREGHQSPGSEQREVVAWGPLRSAPGLILRIVFRFASDSPIVRFRYELKAATSGARAEFANGRLDYFSISGGAFARAREVQLANFQRLTHSYNLSETDFTVDELAVRSGILSPILALSDTRHSLVLAYEHGSTVPDAYLHN